MPDTLIRRAACALNPYRPIMTLAELARARRSTAISWATGHRRPSIETLKILCNLLKERRAVLYQQICELENLIEVREGEPRARGRRHSISKDAGANHMSPHTTPAVATTITKVIAILGEAETSANWNLSLLMVQRAHRCLEELLMQL
jgi:hypothetical protein